MKEPVDHMENQDIQGVKAVVQGEGDPIEAVYKLRKVVFTNSPLLGTSISFVFEIN